MTVSFLDKIIFGAKRIAYQLKEKPKASLDDHAMEHMIFYHGLGGSSPENEKESKIVRADIKEAIANKSGTAMCLALKLSPTIWQDRLTEIFSQLTDAQKQLAIELIASKPQQLDRLELIEGNSSSIAIAYPDWRVRANAANILSWLDAEQAAPALALCLNSNTTDSVMSFCYIAYALGKLQGEQAKAALQLHLDNEDSWLRVDAAGALACFDFENTALLLAQALLNEQEGLDYMAYAISRQHKPEKFLQAKTKQQPEQEDQINWLQIIQGGCRLIYGIVEAAQHSFSPDLIVETESNLCLPRLMQLLENNPDPIIADTALLLSAKDLPLQMQMDDIEKRVIENLKKALQNSSLSAAELSHTIRLAGRLKLKEAQPLLTQLLLNTGYALSKPRPSDHPDVAVLRAHESRPDINLNPIIQADKSRSDINLDPTMRADESRPYEISPYNLGFSQINGLITSLGELGNEKTSVSLIDFANGLFNINERCQKPLSKQPVWEDEPAKATAYWHVLKALGNISIGDCRGAIYPPVEDCKGAIHPPIEDCRGAIHPPVLSAPAVSFLFSALADYAPDKRACALESLITVHKNNPQLSFPERIDLILQRGLKDPSPIMQSAAITAIVNLEEVDLINDILPLIEAQENTISKQSLACIAHLYKSNKFNQANYASTRQKIKVALQAKLQTIKEEHKKIGIMDILARK